MVEVQSAQHRAALPIVNIVGELVALGPLRRDLLPVYQRWINDFGAVRNLGIPPRPLTLEQEQTWFDGESSGNLAFTIYERASLAADRQYEPNHLDQRSRTAEFGILIGEADARGRGYGTETTRLMLDYTFTAIGLHSVLLRVHEYNLAGQRAYAKAGFKEVGRRRQRIHQPRARQGLRAGRAARLSGDHPTVRLARRDRGAGPPMSSVLPSAHTQTRPAFLPLARLIRCPSLSALPDTPHPGQRSCR